MVSVESCQAHFLDRFPLSSDQLSPSLTLKPPVHHRSPPRPVFMKDTTEHRGNRKTISHDAQSANAEQAWSAILRHLPHRRKAPPLHSLEWFPFFLISNTDVMTKVLATGLHKEQRSWGLGGLVRNVGERLRVDKSVSAYVSDGFVLHCATLYFA